jgi:hypothetical protein
MKKYMPPKQGTWTPPMPIFGRIGGQFVIPDRKAPGHQARKPANTAPSPRQATQAKRAPKPANPAPTPKPAARKADERPKLIVDRDIWGQVSDRHEQLYLFRGDYYLSDNTGLCEKIDADDAFRWALVRGHLI